DRELIPTPRICRGHGPQVLSVARPSFDRLRMRLGQRHGARRGNISDAPAIGTIDAADPTSAAAPSAEPQRDLLPPPLRQPCASARRIRKVVAAVDTMIDGVAA